MAIARASTRSYATSLLNGEIFYTLKEAKIVIEECDAITTRCVRIHL